ncbi:hypothetical protein BCEP4_2360008 [Burkholderia cepacia]|nr:hypothetical protein BCEP4_2360008 [Burkholderia cepacia]
MRPTGTNGPHRVRPSRPLPEYNSLRINTPTGLRPLKQAELSPKCSRRSLRRRAVRSLIGVTNQMSASANPDHILA